MRKKGKRSRTLFGIAISLLCGIILLNSCHIPDPTLQPYIDVLQPGPSVEILGFTEEGDVIVSPEFMIWVDDLKAEIRRLRELLNE